MGFLDFLKRSKLEDVQRDFDESFEEELDDVEQENELSPEEDYWYIDADEKSKAQKDITEFYNECIRAFERVACSEGLIDNGIEVIAELEETGRKITTSFLNDRYIVHRKETQPEIYYNYEISLAIQSGALLAKKWEDAPDEITAFASNIIRETPEGYITSLYGNGIKLNNDMERIKFVNKVEEVWYEILKWYYKSENFDQYIERSLLAAFYLGTALYKKQ